MSFEAWVQVGLAAAVAGAYFTIAAVVVPRMQLEDAGLRFSRLFHFAAIAFFVGCGLTHLHIAVHAATEPASVEAHELVFHVAQIAGGWLFIFAAVAFLDVKLVRRRSPEEVEAELLAEHNRELARSNSELANFASVVSHDLKQPLRTINGFNGMLARRYADQLDEKGRHYIEESMTSTEHMSDLLDGIMAYSKVGGSELEREQVDIGEVVEKVLSALAAQIRATGAEIEVGELPTIWGDRSQLEQVFQNLISNALKFSPGEDVRVQVRSEPHEEGWMFEVADNGIGIEERHRERVFKMFARLHTRDDYPGTGAGLSIVSKVIQRHQGRIWVEDGPGGKGSSFRFTLPERIEVKKVEPVTMTLPRRRRNKAAEAEHAAEA